MVGGPATYRMVRGEALYRTVQSGEGGIRTPETLSGLTVFKTAGFNHSPTSPLLIVSCDGHYENALRSLTVSNITHRYFVGSERISTTTRRNKLFSCTSSE
jgi:hypothetical protein